MEYLANVLPVEPDKWTLNAASMTNSAIELSSGGFASTYLTHEQVIYTPKAFKVTCKFVGTFDEFAPAAFAKLLIKDKNDKYQIFTAPLIPVSSTPSYHIMQAELLTNVDDFKDLIFQFNAEESVIISEWKLYPSSDIGTNTITTIEAMLPQFLYAFNEKEIGIDSHDTEIVNLPFAMGTAGNLSAHLFFSYEVNVACRIVITIRMDGTAEPYTPASTIVEKGIGFISIPHSFLQVQPAAHMINVYVKLEPLEDTLTYGLRGSVNIPVLGTYSGSINGVDSSGGALSGMSSGDITGTAEGIINSTFTRVESQSVSGNIPAKGIRYTCEGRGILDGASGEFPHAEVVETHEMPTITIDALNVYSTHNIQLLSDVTGDSSSTYVMPTISQQTLKKDDIQIESSGKVGSIVDIQYTTTHSSEFSAVGDLSITSGGVVITNGVGEGIITTNDTFPNIEYIPYIYGFGVYGTGNIDGITYAFSSDGVTWYTLENGTWNNIELTYTDMSSRGISRSVLNTLSHSDISSLFELTGLKRLAIAAYLKSVHTTLSMTLQKIHIYFGEDVSNTEVLPPTLLLAVGEDHNIRVHYTSPSGSVVTLICESSEGVTEVQAPYAASFMNIPVRTNNIPYRIVAKASNQYRESILSNELVAVPSKVIPSIRLAGVDISTISIEWTLIGIPPEAYKVYIGEDSSSMTCVDTTTEKYAVITDLPNGITYFIAVTAVYTDEESALSNILEATPNATPTAE